MPDLPLNDPGTNFAKAWAAAAAAPVLDLDRERECDRDRDWECLVGLVLRRKGLTGRDGTGDVFDLDRKGEIGRIEGGSGEGAVLSTPPVEYFLNIRSISS